MKKLLSFLRTPFLWVLLLPYAFIFAGAASNQLVIIANHGKFPVRTNAVHALKWVDPENPLPDGMLDEVHCIMTDETHLNFLADIIDEHEAVKSVGDLALEFGEWSNTFAPFLYIGLVIVELKKKE